MKITFTIDSITRCGKERQMLILASKLLARNYEIKIICLKPASDNYLKQYSSIANIVVVLKKRSIVKQFIEVRKIIKQEIPELLVSYDNKSALYSLIISSTKKIKFINASLRHGIRLNKPNHYIRSLIYRLSPNVIANSESGLKANKLNKKRSRFVLYNGVEKKFSTSIGNRERQDSLKKLGLSVKSKDTIFISVANLVPYKDYYTIFQALKAIKEEYDFHYIILGDGPLRLDYEKKIKEYLLEDRITIIGQIENVPDYLAISDYMIHSSRGEGISNAILEGMYAGLPIIATNVGGIPETVWPGSSALFEYKNYKQLVSILKNLENNFGDFNRNDPYYQAHLEQFSDDSMVENFEKIIRQVMGNYA